MLSRLQPFLMRRVSSTIRIGNVRQSGGAGTLNLSPLSIPQLWISQVDPLPGNTRRERAIRRISRPPCTLPPVYMSPEQARMSEMDACLRVLLHPGIVSCVTGTDQ